MEKEETDKGIKVRFSEYTSFYSYDTLEPCKYFYNIKQKLVFFQFLKKIK